MFFSETDSCLEGNKKICNINRMDSNGDALPGIQKIIVRRRQKNGSNGKDAPVCKKKCPACRI